MGSIQKVKILATYPDGSKRVIEQLTTDSIEGLLADIDVGVLYEILDIVDLELDT